jgi:hypothetical protein
MATVMTVALNRRHFTLPGMPGGNQLQFGATL